MIALSVQVQGRLSVQLVREVVNLALSLSDLHNNKYGGAR